MTGHGQFDLVIRHGMVVLPEVCIEADIAVKDGKIAAIGHLEHIAEETTVFDAAGLTILPGAVDIHVHFNEPGLESWEGFEAGSAALAAGGCTTYVDMPLNGVPPTVNREALNLKLARAQERSCVDYALWGGLVPGNIETLDELAAAGVVGFKAFMSDPGGEGEGIFARSNELTLLEGMKKIAAIGGLLALHAESEDIVQASTASIRQQGRMGMQDYIESRPVIAEVEAVSRALLYAKHTGCRLHFVHISTPEALELIDAAKASGMDVSTETCPHYLLLTNEDADRLGAVAKCAPPLRSADNRERLWNALLHGSVDIIASDHSPCPPSLKQSDDMFEIWGGISGAQSTLLLMLEEGYLARGLSLPQIARLVALAPASRMGLDDRKGSIEIGKDADFALVDFNKAFTLTAQELLYTHVQSPYLNHTFPCSIAATFCRGNQVYDKQHGVSESRSGSWLKPRMAGVDPREERYA
ncbi:allantoinase [Paenibacillus massiliensis]|uniref:allantoinase n=1 Tax=Paenibacillus massiliensis TaxID=225917 RepID=UPI0003F68398|nr:allantoinase [Paenibacillus massiliensis]